MDVDPVVATTAYTISTTNVATTTNTGATWTDITGDIAVLDPGTLRTIKVVAGAPTRIFVGADRGVFETTTASLGAWSELDRTRLPNAPVFDLDYDPVTDTLYASTLGRGAFSITQVSKTAIPIAFSTLSGKRAADERAVPRQPQHERRVHGSVRVELDQRAGPASAVDVGRYERARTLGCTDDLEPDAARFRGQLRRRSGVHDVARSRNVRSVNRVPGARLFLELVIQDGVDGEWREIGNGTEGRIRLAERKRWTGYEPRNDRLERRAAHPALEGRARIRTQADTQARAGAQERADTRATGPAVPAKVQARAVRAAAVAAGGPVARAAR